MNRQQTPEPLGLAAEQPAAAVLPIRIWDGAPTEAPGAAAALKGLFDAFFSAAGLLLLSPLFLLIALAIKLADGGPIFYRQSRIGQYGRPFRIWKFRTMVPDADKQGLPITSEGDRRVTRVGSFLRRTKLDELPQLLNVFNGEMSLVGPRPEVPRYVAHYTPEQREILKYKPGITDLASLCFRDEETLLQTSENTEQFYLEHCLPRKLKLNGQYAREANVLTDTWIILQTICPYWCGVLGLYGTVLTAALWLAELLLNNFASTGSSWARSAGPLPLVVGIQLACLVGRRQCRGLLCYFGMPELVQLTRGLLQAALILFTLSLLVPHLLPARNLILMDLCISTSLLNGLRIALLRWRERTEGEQALSGTPTVRVGIIGAGSLGAELGRYFNTQKSLGRTTVVFFDDDFGKWQKSIHEIPVAGMPECLLQGWSERLDEVAIALPDACPARLAQIHQLLEKTRLKVYSLSSPTPAWPGLQLHVA